MDTKITKLKAGRIQSVTVLTHDEVQAAEAKALTEIAKHVEAKGFRAGKAPMNIVRERAGEDRILEETVRMLLPEVIKQAMEKSGAKPILRPNANVTSKDPLTISLIFVERPTVSVKKPDAIKVEKKEIKAATAEDIESFIKKALAHDRSETSVNRAAKIGDLVRTGLSTTDEAGKEVKELTVNTASIILGEEELLKELEPHLVGMKKDEKKTVTVDFPKDHDLPGIRGKKLKISVTAKDIAEVKFPELTAEYLKERLKVDKSPADFRKDVGDMLTAQRKDAEMKRREDELYEKIRTATTVELPEELVDAEVREIVEDFSKKLEEQGSSLEKWMKASGKEPKTVVSEMKDIATSRITLRLGIQEMIKAKKIEPSADEMKTQLEEVQKMLSAGNREFDPSDLAPEGRIYESIKMDLGMRKLVSTMID